MTKKKEVTEMAEYQMEEKVAFDGKKEFVVLCRRGDNRMGCYCFGCNEDWGNEMLVARFVEVLEV